MSHSNPPAERVSNRVRMTSQASDSAANLPPGTLRRANLARAALWLNDSVRIANSAAPPSFPALS